MRKSRYQANSSVEQPSAHLSGEQPQKAEKQHLASLPQLGGLSKEKQHAPTLAKHHDAVASDQTKSAAYKAREEHITVETSQRPDRVVKVSILWLQGSLVLGNLAILVTAVVSLLAWYQLRQEHFLARAETLENQGVKVQAIESGWRLEVGLLVTGLGLLLHWLVGGVIMPLRIGDCKGFAVGAYLIFNVAAMLWQVCAAMEIFHILPAYPSFSHMKPGTERFLVRWGCWLVASYLSCLPVQLISAAVHISFDKQQDVDEESVQLRRNIGSDGQGHTKVKPDAAIGPERASQDLAFYVTEMPAEQLKRKSEEPLSPFSRIRSESNNSTLPPSFRSLYLDSSKRFDDYSFYYDEYLDMEECWEESDQEEGESIFCSGSTPPPPYNALAINV